MRSLIIPNRSSRCTVTLQNIKRHCKETSKEEVTYFLSTYLSHIPKRVNKVLVNISVLKLEIRKHLINHFSHIYGVYEGETFCFYFLCCNFLLTRIWMVHSIFFYYTWYLYGYLIHILQFYLYVFLILSNISCTVLRLVKVGFNNLSLYLLWCYCT